MLWGGLEVLILFNNFFLWLGVQLQYLYDDEDDEDEYFDGDDLVMYWLLMEVDWFGE